MANAPQGRARRLFHCRIVDCRAVCKTARTLFLSTATRALSLPHPSSIARHSSLDIGLQQSVEVILLQTTSYSCQCFFLLYSLFHHFSPMEPINELRRCPSRVWSQEIYPSLPGSRLRGFIARYRFSTPTPRQSVIERFVLTSSRPHAFRWGNQRERSLLLKLELTNSDLMGVRCTH